MERSIPDNAGEMRALVDKIESTDDEDERTDAILRLHELASEWRGYPGQRRRGELPAGVEIRSA